MSLIEVRDSSSSHAAENHSLIEKKPLTGCEKACLIGELALWAIATVASIGTLLLFDYPKERMVEVWTQLTAPDDVHEDTGYGSVAVEDRSKELDLEDDFFEVASNGPSGREDQAYAAASNLRDTSALVRGGTTSLYTEYLGEKYPDRFIVVNHMASDGHFGDEFVDSVVVPAVEKAIKDGNDFVFVPAVYKSFRNHNILFTINLKNPALEYFDPKGKASGDQELKNMNKTVKELHSELSHMLSKKFPKHFVDTSSSEKIQRDHTNCGVFVSKFMEERLKIREIPSRSAFRQVTSEMNGLNPKMVRREMASALVEWSANGVHPSALSSGRSKGLGVKWADEEREHIGEVRAIPRNPRNNYYHVPVIKGGDKSLRGITKPESSQV